MAAVKFHPQGVDVDRDGNEPVSGHEVTVRRGWKGPLTVIPEGLSGYGYPVECHEGVHHGDIYVATDAGDLTVQERRHDSAVRGQAGRDVA